MRRFLSPLCLLFFTWLPSPAAHGDVVALLATQDNTLYESTAGDLSNGAGNHFFAGRSNAGIRRGVLAFSIADQLPEGSVIHSAALTLNISNVPVGADATTLSLHRLTADWGEGASDAPGPEGMGTDAEPGDATWLNTFFPDDLWTAPGGDFEATASAALDVGTGIGFQTWDSAAMAVDVQGWLDDPATDFGWILIGDETLSPTARRFDSRTIGDASLRPQLVVNFTPPVLPPAIAIPTLSQWGLVLMTILLLLAAARHLKSARVSPSRRRS